MTLFLDVGRIDQIADGPAERGPHLQVATHTPGNHAGESVIIETAEFLGVLEPVAVPVPERLRERRQVGSQRVAIELIEAQVPATTEHLEEVVEVEVPDAGELEFEQCRLARIGVDCMYASWLAQGVVEGIAPGAGDDQHRVFRPDGERLAVDRRILPAGVVDQ